MTKRDFLEQFVLNARRHGYISKEGYPAVVEYACAAWDAIGKVEPPSEPRKLTREDVQASLPRVPFLERK